jgi:peptidoglycan-associated lipoprotein
MNSPDPTAPEIAGQTAHKRNPMHAKTRRTAASIGLIAALGLLVAGCSSTGGGMEQTGVTVETRNADPVTKPIAQPEPQKVVPITAGPVQSSKLPPELSDPKNILSRRSIHFDYDKFEIRDEYKSLLAAHAKFLTSRRDFRMLIQGNADERGSREYNIALGQKRADAIRRALVLLGASEEQLESVSLGEEKPKSDGHDETAWAENRRGDMLYRGEY